MDRSDLTALVSSRICHDLISPIGAISNGVELISERAGSGTPELDLIGDSASSATAKLRYFRVAFGAVPKDSRIQASELTAAVETMFGGRSSVSLRFPDDGLPRLTAKTLFLALLCQEKCLPLGGDTEGEVSGDRFRLRTSAPRTRLQTELWRLASDGANAADVAPGDVQFLLLGEVLRDHGLTLEKDITEEAIELSVGGFGASV